MAHAKAGNKVQVLYRGTLEDGQVFDATDDSKPFEFTLGTRLVVPGFERAVIGMAPGDTKTVRCPPEDAFGHRRDELALTIPRAHLPSDVEPQMGMTLHVRSKDDRQKGISRVMITEMCDQTVTLDGNHPLAGKELIYEITLLKIFS